MWYKIFLTVQQWILECERTNQKEVEAPMVSETCEYPGQPKSSKILLGKSLITVEYYTQLYERNTCWYLVIWKRGVMVTRKINSERQRNDGLRHERIYGMKYIINKIDSEIQSWTSMTFIWHGTYWWQWWELTASLSLVIFIIMFCKHGYESGCPRWSRLLGSSCASDKQLVINSNHFSPGVPDKQLVVNSVITSRPVYPTNS